MEVECRIVLIVYIGIYVTISMRNHALMINSIVFSLKYTKIYYCSVYLLTYVMNSVYLLHSSIHNERFDLIKSIKYQNLYNK